MLPPAIIDTHQHLWNLSQFELGWLKEEPFCQLHHDHTLEDYGRDTDGLNVTQSIYMEVDVLESQQPGEAQWILDLCQQTDNRVAAAVISGRPGTKGFREYIERFRPSPFLKGVRDNLYGKPEGYCSRKDFVADIRMLGEAGLSFDIETPTEGLPDAAHLIDACPETQFILDHCGNPMIRSGNLTTWQANVAAVAQRKNVVVKISGLFTWVDPERWSIDDIAPVINHLWEHFGPDRVMFGSDWPVVTVVAPYRRWVEVVSEVASNRNQEIQQKLFHDNASRVYGLTNSS